MKTITKNAVKTYWLAYGDDKTNYYVGNISFTPGKDGMVHVCGVTGYASYIDRDMPQLEARNLWSSKIDEGYSRVDRTISAAEHKRNVYDFGR